MHPLVSFLLGVGAKSAVERKPTCATARFRSASTTLEKPCVRTTLSVRINRLPSSAIVVRARALVSAN